MKRNKGFTLIELMIVIAIIAIIAAIAIPGLLSSQRASNERNASTSLKTLLSANADFRSNDRDGNVINDFWTKDVSGLYRVKGTDGNGVKLIEVSVAQADGVPYSAAFMAAALTASTKAGFWYQSLTTDKSVTPNEAYAATTDATMGAVHNMSRCAYIVYPDSYGSSGKLVFIVNEGATVYKKDPAAGVAAQGLPPKSLSASYVDWPADPTTSGFSKMD